MPKLEEILKQLPEDRDKIKGLGLGMENFLIEQRKNISVDDEVLKNLIDPLIKLHDDYKDKAKKNDDNNVYYYAKSYLNLSQAFKKISDSGTPLHEIKIKPYYDAFGDLRFGKEKKEKQHGIKI